MFDRELHNPHRRRTSIFEADGITDGLATIKIEHLGGTLILINQKLWHLLMVGTLKRLQRDLGTISMVISRNLLRNAESTADPKAPIVDNSGNPADAVAYGDIINIKIIDEDN